jgi:hypothetical protein
MSSFIAFPHDKAARIFNSTFNTLHSFLIERHSLSAVAEVILRENPIASEIKYLNLSKLSRDDLVGLRSEFRILAEGADSRNDPAHLPQFLSDMEAVRNVLEDSISDR